MAQEVNARLGAPVCILSTDWIRSDRIGNKNTLCLWVKWVIKITVLLCEDTCKSYYVNLDHYSLANKEEKSIQVACSRIKNRACAKRLLRILVIRNGHWRYRKTKLVAIVAMTTGTNHCAHYFSPGPQRGHKSKLQGYKISPPLFCLFVNKFFGGGAEILLVFRIKSKSVYIVKFL